MMYFSCMKRKMIIGIGCGLLMVFSGCAHLNRMPQSLEPASDRVVHMLPESLFDMARAAEGEWKLNGRPEWTARIRIPGLTQAPGAGGPYTLKTLEKVVQKHKLRIEQAHILKDYLESTRAREALAQIQLPIYGSVQNLSAIDFDFALLLPAGLWVDTRISFSKSFVSVREECAGKLVAFIQLWIHTPSTSETLLSQDQIHEQLLAAAYEWSVKPKLAKNFFQHWPSRSYCR